MQEASWWSRLRMRGIDLHTLPVVHAACVGLSFMESIYPDETKRMVEYRRLAKIVGIQVEEDPALAAARHKAQMAVVEAEFGGGLL